MKRKYILVTALMMLIFLTGIAAAVPPQSPPAPQNLGLGDTKFENVSTATCKNCHPDPKNIHHVMVNSPDPTHFGTALGCNDCHPTVGVYPNQAMLVSKECHDCHNGVAWDQSPIVNLSVIRGSPGRPHHNITKRSLWSGINASFWAADRQCKSCHGSLIANYNDGHSIPAYNASMVTPFADFKINSTVGKGFEYGGCAVCHDQQIFNGVQLNSNHDTHHYVKFWVGNQCNNCHVSSGARAEPVPDYNPEPSANVYRVWFNQSYTDYLPYLWDTSQLHVELRNSTMLNAGDTLNGTGCQKCHSMQSLHNIEYNATYNQANKIQGFGHTGNNSDCNGCHYGNGLFLDVAPLQGASIIQLESLSPSIVSANVDTGITVTGNNIQQPGYTTQVLVDGLPVTSTVTDTTVTFNVNLAAGGHEVQVTKTNDTIPEDNTTSTALSISAQAPPTITKAELSSDVITITGSALGTTDMTSVVITKSDGRQLIAATTSWSDAQITANGADAVVGDSVTVLTKTGSAIATIEAGATPTPTPTPTLTVTSPNGGESWARQTTHEIKWTTEGATGNTVTIYTSYINNKGQTITTAIATDVTNSGSYSWNVPRTQVTDNDYKITVTSSGGYSDTSDNSFSITAR